jgi:hypothetical protein
MKFAARDSSENEGARGLTEVPTGELKNFASDAAADCCWAIKPMLRIVFSKMLLDSSVVRATLVLWLSCCLSFSKENFVAISEAVIIFNGFSRSGQRVLESTPA